MQNSISRTKSASITIIAALVTPLVPGLSTTTALAVPTAARTADSFVDSTGVVVKFGNGVPYSNYPAVRDKLLASGIRNIRESNANPVVVSRLQELGNAGIKIVWLMMPELGTKPDASYWGSSAAGANVPVVDFLKNTLGVQYVRGVEMNNEEDRFYGNLRWYPTDTTPLSNDPASNRYWGKYLQAATEDTYNALKGDPATAHLPLIGPSFTSRAAYLSVGDLGNWLDYGCTHWYMAGRHPFTNGWGSSLNGYSYGSYGYTLNNLARISAPGKPMVSSEGFGDTATNLNVKPDGTIDATHYPEVVHGRYLPRWYFRHYLGESKWGFVYDLVDDGTDPNRNEENFGMLRHDLSEKPGYKAVKNVLNLLKEPGVSFTPGTLDYSLTGSTANVQNVLFQRSSGDYYLAAWVEKSCWNVATNTMISVPNQAVTLTVPVSIGSATVYTLDDAGDMTSAAAPISSGQISLSLADRVSLVKLTPAAPSGIGLRGQYYGGNNFNTLVHTQVDSTVNFNWGSGSAMSGVGPENFTVRWAGQVQANETGTYTFSTTTDDGIRLWVNDQLLIDKWVGQSATWTGTIALTAGEKYPIRMEYYEAGGNANAKLEWLRPGQTVKEVIPQVRLYPASWVAPGNGTGLKGQYYSGKTLSTLIQTRTDPTVNFNWGGGSAMSSVGPDNFSVAWSGTLQALDAGTYTFTTTTDDGVRLWVDNQLIIDKWLNQSATWSGEVTLTAGQQVPIRMEFYENTGNAAAKLEWLPPVQTARQVIPQSQLFPAP